MEDFGSSVSLVCHHTYFEKHIITTFHMLTLRSTIHSSPCFSYSHNDEYTVNEKLINSISDKVQCICLRCELHRFLKELHVNVFSVKMWCVARFLCNRSCRVGLRGLIAIIVNSVRSRDPYRRLSGGGEVTQTWV